MYKIETTSIINILHYNNDNIIFAHCAGVEWLRPYWKWALSVQPFGSHLEKWRFEIIFVLFFFYAKCLDITCWAFFIHPTSKSDNFLSPLPFSFQDGRHVIHSTLFWSLLISGDFNIKFQSKWVFITPNEMTTNWTLCETAQSL